MKGELYRNLALPICKADQRLAGIAVSKFCVQQKFAIALGAEDRRLNHVG